MGAVVSLSSLTDLNGQQGMGYCSFKGAQQKVTFLENWEPIFIISLGLDIWLVASRGSWEEVPFFTHQAGGPEASDSFYTKGC